MHQLSQRALAAVRSGTAQTVEAKDQCFECHKDVRAETWKISHHPIREGLMSCRDCHNPHGSPTEGRITAASVNDQCYDCHASIHGSNHPSSPYLGH